MELIDKSALVAEIENRIDRCNTKKWSCPANTQVEALCDNKISAYKEILSFLDTTEVKNVDLDWKNVRELCVLSAVVELEKGRSLTDQEHYTEVIKRFKAQKGE